MEDDDYFPGDFDYYDDTYEDGSPDGGFDANFDGPGEEHNIFDELDFSDLTLDTNVSNIIRQQRKLENSLEFTQVEDIVFKIYTHDEVLDNSVIMIMNSANINSTFLGARDDIRCNYCNQDNRSCNGHLGHILLPYTPHPLFPAEINNILSIFCPNPNCRTFRLTTPPPPDTRLSDIANIVRTRSCPLSGTTCNFEGTGVERKSVLTTPYRDRKAALAARGERKTALTPIVVQYEEIYELFSTITREQADMIGMKINMPTDLIMRSIPVLPYNVRPRRLEGEITLTVHIEDLYRNIVSNVSDLIQLLINAISTYVDPNDENLLALRGLISYDMPIPQYEISPDKYIRMIEMFEKDEIKKRNIIQDIYNLLNISIPDSLKELVNGNKKSGKQQTMGGIREKIQPKDGFIRNNMMGRRTNYVLRTVAAPGGYLNVEEIGIPQYSRSNLTIPITVRDYNIDALMLHLINGDILDVHKPREDGTYSNINVSIINRDSLTLSIGDIVDRRIQDGDIVLVNRQPTLNKQNLVCLNAKIIPEKVIRINLSITSPLNADFDGDELNVHVPQSIEGRVESRLFGVTNNFINETNNTAMFGIVYNSLSGCYMLTNNENNDENRAAYRKLQSDENAKKIGYMEDFDIILRQAMKLAHLPATVLPDLKNRCEAQGQIWGTGHALLSLAFPRGFYYKSTRADTKHMEIRDGILMHGIMDSREIGRRDRTVLTEMYSRFRSQLTKCMSIIQFVANGYLNRNALSVNYFDCVPQSSAFYEEIDKQIKNAQKNLTRIMAHVPHTVNQQRDQDDLVLDQLNRAGKTPEDFEMAFPQGTALLIMARSGAKGDTRNLAQMSVGLGVQRVEGRMIQKILPGNRTLPTYSAGSESIGDLGFVQNNFVKGLNPIEYFFHNMTVRESLVDTSNGTRDTGSLNRNLNKALENVITDDSGAVFSNNTGRVVLNVYGGDGIRPNGLSTVSTPSDIGYTSFFIDIDSLAHQINSEYEAKAKNALTA